MEIGKCSDLYLCLAILMPLSARAADSLPSWNDKPARQAAIVDFVTAATTPGDPGYVEPHLRVAVFDNDGTLWAEQPVYFQFMYAHGHRHGDGRQRPCLGVDPCASGRCKG